MGVEEVRARLKAGFCFFWIQTEEVDRSIDLIGEIGGSAWSIMVDPQRYDGVLSLRAFDSSGSYFDLNLNTDASGNIRFDAIPEPSTFVTLTGLLGMGLIGYWWRRRRAA